MNPYIRVKSGKSDNRLNSGSNLVSFIFELLEKNKLTKQTVNILIFTVSQSYGRIYPLSEVSGLYPSCERM